MNFSESETDNKEDIESATTDFQGTPISGKKKRKRLIIILIAAIILIILGIVGYAFLGSTLYKAQTTTSVSSITDQASADSQTKEGSSKGTDSKEADDSEDTDAGIADSAKEDTAKKHYEVDLTAGQYKAGVDLPAGTYTLTVSSGSGNVSTDLSQGGLNELIGSEADGYAKQSLTNVRLRTGTTLSIGGSLVLHCVSSAADTENQTQRPSTETKTYDLAEGDYTAGKEFPAGTYNIIATGVSGNVSSSNLYEGGLNEIMGTDGFGIKQYNNAVFQDGTTLNISGTSVQLVYIGE